MRRLFLAAFGLLVLMGSPAAAQIIPSSTTTTSTSEPPTTASTTSTIEVTTTTLVTSSTTATTAKTTATTGKRSTTSSTSGKSTTTTELKSTNTFVPPKGRRGTGTTAPLLPFVDTRRPGDRYLGLFVVLSAGGFGAAALIVGSQLVATRPIPTAARGAARNGKRAGTGPALPSQPKFLDDEIEND